MDKVTLLAIDMPADNYAKSMDIYGQRIMLREKISRHEKEAAASELLAMSMIFDTELGITYDVIYSDAARAFVLAKYYTNIDTEAYNTPEGWYALYDILNDFGNILYDFISPSEVDEFMSIYTTLRCTAKLVFEREHSLDFAIMKFLSGALTPDVQMETVAEARSAAELLIDALGAIRNQRVINGKGGSPLSFAKKNTSNGPA